MSNKTNSERRKIIINEDYVSFETAKLLKEKGFPQDALKINTCYKYNGKFCNNARSMSGIDRMICFMAPTNEIAEEWLKNNNIKLDI